MSQPTSRIPAATVLAYHNILPAGTPLPDDLHCIPLDRLVEQVNTLARNGFTNIPLRRAFDELVTGDLRADVRQYAVTFDDGYANLAEQLPGLADRIRPTVFLLTGYASQSNLIWNTRTPLEQKHLSLSQIIRLSEYGIDMQFHGTDHHNLLKFDEQELRSRFRMGQSWFEQHLGKRPDFIAYPYGYCNALVENIASEYFTGGLTVTHGAWCGTRARFALNRLSVPAYLDGDGLVSVLLSPPEQRWYEVERRAPWRKKAGDV
jgi:peptidoglycan/xylan/chitin deacetylase (PgdA/CDA1 family)